MNKKSVIALTATILSLLTNNNIIAIDYDYDESNDVHFINGEYIKYEDLEKTKVFNKGYYLRGTRAGFPYDFTDGGTIDDIGISTDGKTLRIRASGSSNSVYWDYFDIGGSSGATYTAGNGLNISDNNEISISNIIGKNSTSSHAQNTDDTNFIIGNNSTIEGDNAIVFGSGVNNQSQSKNWIQIGNQSEGTLDYGNSYSVSIGNNSRANAESVVAIGQEAYSEGTATIVLGANASSTAAAEGAVVLGADSSASESEIVSVGHKKGDTYFGNGSVSNTYSDNLYRRVINVADGVDDHDVTTLGQVKKLVEKAGGTTLSGSNDVTISSDNSISIAKNGQIASGDSGIVTGDTVYKVTNKLNAALTDQGTSITAATNKITSLNTSMETLRNSMVQMNTSISDTIADLPNSLGNFINKDLSNLSTDGQNTLKALIKSEIKNQMGTSASNSVSAVSTMDGNFMVQAAADTSYVDNAVAGKADKAELSKLADMVATKADKKELDALATKVDTKADKTYVDSELAKKADQFTVDEISTKVDTNAKNIAANTEAIKGNTSAIADLKENKADVSGANIDVASWSEKLGTGKVASGDAGLVTGGTVFNALEQKADIGYVNVRFQAMDSEMQEINRTLTRNINKVGAGAAALAGLHPQEYDPNNKLDFAVGYGHYHNANATALGMYYRPNAVTTLSLAGTIGNGDPMLSAGLSFKLGMGKHVEKVMVTKEDFSAMQNRLVAQDNELADQKEEMANQKEKIEQLEAMVKQLMAK